MKSKNEQARDYIDKWQKEIGVAMILLAEINKVNTVTITNDLIGKKKTYSITTVLKKKT
jgi:hypothetical protein